MFQRGKTLRGSPGSLVVLEVTSEDWWRRALRLGSRALTTLACPLLAVTSEDLKRQALHL
jgi:hypothetical protein